MVEPSMVQYTSAALENNIIRTCYADRFALIQLCD